MCASGRGGRPHGPRLLRVTPGQDALFALGGLPLGSDTFVADAFPLDCAEIGTTVPTWVSDPLVAVVAVDPPVELALILHPNGRSSVSIEFQADAGDGGGLPHTQECTLAGCTCVSGFADCDGTLANGCETSIASDAANCGACGVACAGGSSCVNGTCASAGIDGGTVPSCPMGANVAVADGGTLIPLSGTLRELVIDSCNAHVFVSNSSLNQIEDYSTRVGSLAAPIPVGSKPIGFDITPDNRRLYVANSGGSNISVVDLTAHQELKKIAVAPGFSSDTPLSLAIAGNGKALFSTTFAGSGFGGRMLHLDLASEVVSVETDFFANGATTEATVLKASTDRSSVAAVAGDISSAPVFVYLSATGAFGREHDLNGFVSRVAVNANGTQLLVNGTFVLDGSASLLGTIPGGGPWAGFAPSGSVGYRAAAGGIEILDTSRFLVTGSIAVTADTTIGAIGGSSVGNLAVSSDGRWLAMITDHGVTLVNLP